MTTERITSEIVECYGMLKGWIKGHNKRTQVQTLQGHKSSTHPIAMTCDYGCQESGNFDIWNVFFLVLFYRTVFVLYVLTLFNEGANLTWVHKALKDSILFIYLFLKERASVFLLMFSAKQGKYCFIMSLVWLGIEPGTSRTWSQHSTTRLLRGMICRTGRRDLRVFITCHKKPLNQQTDNLHQIKWKMNTIEIASFVHLWHTFVNY